MPALLRTIAPFPPPRPQPPSVGPPRSRLLREPRAPLGLLGALPPILPTEHLHSGKRIATGGVGEGGRGRGEQGGVDRPGWTEGSAQRETAPRFRRMGDEYALASANGENDSIRHLQPPETAGRIVTTSPGCSVVSIP